MSTGQFLRPVFFGENYMSDKDFDSAILNILKNEGGYTDGSNQVKDMPTNMGIQQATLNFYNKIYPEKNYPQNVKLLNLQQVREIYKRLYWDNTKIPDIKNARIRDAVFDINVMGGAGIVVQLSFNEFVGTHILTVDGIIGTKTVAALNEIQDSYVDDFMVILKKIRLEYLKKTPNWKTAKNCYIARTNEY